MIDFYFQESKNATARCEKILIYIFLHELQKKARENLALNQLHYGKYAPGLTLSPYPPEPTLTSKCKCGPDEFPVLPTLIIC